MKSISIGTSEDWKRERKGSVEGRRGEERMKKEYQKKGFRVRRNVVEQDMGRNGFTNIIGGKVC